MRRRRVPVILQPTGYECGVACLAMILNYFGRKTGLEECRAKLAASHDGVTARAITATAQGFGLRTRALSLRAQDLSHLSVPSILHWNSNHFVILERWTSDRVEVVDPGLGRQELSMTEFEAAFSGVALFFEPGTDFSRHPERGETVVMS